MASARRKGAQQPAAAPAPAALCPPLNSVANAVASPRDLCKLNASVADCSRTSVIPKALGWVPLFVFQQVEPGEAQAMAWEYQNNVIVIAAMIPAQPSVWRLTRTRSPMSGPDHTLDRQGIVSR